VLGYLADFLFPPERARSLVKFLSGGERNRLLLARLFTRPSNLLVMDEPTNDLDIETLELLEELLLEYAGTVILVSHDREFLNRVVTSTLVLEGEGRVKEYVGGYDDWLRQRTGAAATDNAASEVKKGAKPGTRADSPPKPARLSYKERQELLDLPQQIEVLESEQQAIHTELGRPEFYQQAGAQIAETKARLNEIEQTLRAAYERWELLESRSNE
jgi:ATP-binding cassette subfamily F protein uup